MGNTEMLNNNKRVRESSFELLRLISMWMIVFYHFHTHVLDNVEDNTLFAAIQIPFHIGVPLFILLSGYFNIRFSIKGLCNYLSKVAFYGISIFIIYLILLWYNGNLGELSIKEIADNIFVVSRTDLWFVRSYFILYLFSPFINLNQ